jgi:hypothetical protein
LHFRQRILLKIKPIGSNSTATATLAAICLPHVRRLDVSGAATQHDFIFDELSVAQPYVVVCLFVGLFVCLCVDHNKRLAML